MASLPILRSASMVNARAVSLLGGEFSQGRATSRTSSGQQWGGLKEGGMRTVCMM